MVTKMEQTTTTETTGNISPVVQDYINRLKAQRDVLANLVSDLASDDPEEVSRAKDKVDAYRMMQGVWF